MTIDKHNQPELLGFGALLADAEQDNRERHFERETAHLPGTWEEALPFYRALLEEHHAAMMAADADETMRLRKEAHNLAVKLNDGEPGILAHEDAPGCVLGRKTAALEGSEPLWGQQGAFIVEIGSMKVRMKMDGIFGIAGAHCYWPGFSAHAVEFGKPFLSETGYRSFLGIYAEPQPGISPMEFVEQVLTGYVEGELKGKLLPIAKRYMRDEAA